ncbi:hypothetical protein JCM10135_03460 [Stetteria hydrogenophila]
MLRLAVLLLPGLLLRAVLAPYTCGSDIAQFAGFADTTLRRGLRFFSYSDGSHAAGEGWPYPWPYVYGPPLAVTLAALRILAPTPVTKHWEGGVYHVYVPTDWIVAVKTLLIAFDAASAVALYAVARLLGAGERGAAVCMLLYFYNPLVVYVSSIYGMFDQVALFTLLAGLYLLLKGRRIPAFLAAGLAASVKPTMAVAALGLLAAESSRGWGRALKALPALLAGALLPYLPFALADPYGVAVYVKAVESVASPSHPEPVAYSFNGFSSIAFYAWSRGDAGAARAALAAWPLLFAPLYAAALLAAGKRATRWRLPASPTPPTPLPTGG